MRGLIRFVLGWVFFAIVLVTKNTYLLLFMFGASVMFMLWGLEAMYEDWMNRRDV